MHVACETYQRGALGNPTIGLPSVYPERRLHLPAEKSASVYECFTFILPYNALRGDLNVSRLTCPTCRQIVKVGS